VHSSYIPRASLDRFVRRATRLHGSGRTTPDLAAQLQGRRPVADFRQHAEVDVTPRRCSAVHGVFANTGARQAAHIAVMQGGEFASRIRQPTYASDNAK
jgi:hypothetical protein